MWALSDGTIIDIDGYYRLLGGGLDDDEASMDEESPQSAFHEPPVADEHEQQAFQEAEKHIQQAGIEEVPEQVMDDVAMPAPEVMAAPAQYGVACPRCAWQNPVGVACGRCPEFAKLPGVKRVVKRGAKGRGRVRVAEGPMDRLWRGGIPRVCVILRSPSK